MLIKRLGVKSSRMLFLFVGLLVLVLIAPKLLRAEHQMKDEIVRYLEY